MELTYEEFYEKYYKLIKNVVYKYKFRSSKEDVLQDIMIDIWKSYETIRNTNVEKKEAYVYAIAKYRCSYYLRREHEDGLWLCNGDEYIERYSDNSIMYEVETDVRNGRIIILDDYIKEYRKKRAEYNKEYYKKNKEKRNESSRKYKSKHKEEIKQYNKEHSKKYRQEHKEELAAYQREWRKKKKEEKLNGKTS